MRDGVEVEFDGAGALRQARPLDDGGVQLAGMPDDGAADEDLGAATGVPRQILRGPQRELHTGRAADDPYGLEGVAGLHRPARTPRACRFAQPGQHHADMLRLTRERGVEGGDLVVGGPPVRRNTFNARVSEVGSTTCAIANSATSTVPRDTLRPNASRSRAAAWWPARDGRPPAG